MFDLYIKKQSICLVILLTVALSAIRTLNKNLTQFFIFPLVILAKASTTGL